MTLPPAPPPPTGPGLRRLGSIVLAVSFGLRAFLAWRGGQMFWPDEDRFDAARETVRQLMAGHYRAAGDVLFGHADHLLFRVAGLLPALVEAAWKTPSWVPALFFAGASTWVLGLVRRVARTAGASEGESFLALLLAASTTSLFYYARHFFPYDLSLAWLLLALNASISSPRTRESSVWAGIWASLGFLSYNGYWTLGAAILVAHVLAAFPRPRPMVERAGTALCGLLLPIAGALLLGGLLGHDLLGDAVRFAGTVYLGDPGVAWRFVPAYLWATEHGLAIVWAVSLGAALWLAWRSGRRRLWLWSGLSLLLYALVVAPSDLFGRFIVSGRHVRVLAPFLCLVTAATIWSLPWNRVRRAVLWGLPVFLVLQAAFNFRPPLTQIFPPQFVQLAATFIGEARKRDFGPYDVVNGDFLHSPEWARSGPDRGTVRLRRAHPFQFTPYLFEGYSAAARDLYQSRDLTMRIVRLDAGGAPFTGYPAGMLEMMLRFPDPPLTLLSEPVLSSGGSGHCDLLYVQYDGPEHIRFGLDHWGGNSVLSSSLPLDRSRPHKLLVDLGPLFPPGAKKDTDRLFVKWDDTVVFDQPYAFHPSLPDQIDLGHNSVGASTAVFQWSAELMSLARIPRPWPALPANGQALDRYPGTVHLQLQLPGGPVGSGSEPLISTGHPGRGDVLFIRYEDAEHFRIGHDHWGGGSTLSEPFPFDPTKRLDLVLSLGSLFPPSGPAGLPTPWQHQLYVRCNDTVILNRAAPFHPTTPAEITVGGNRSGSTAAAPRLGADVVLFQEVAPAALPAEMTGYPGAIRLKLRLPPAPAAPAEPLLSTGRGGAGDLLFIRYEDATHFRIGLDHWGHALVLSEPVAFDRSQPLELTIALGTLFPPESDPPLRHRLFVAVDDRVVLNQPAEFHPAPAGSLAIGRNAIGASTAAERLAADVLALDAVPPGTILPLPPAR